MAQARRDPSDRRDSAGSFARSPVGGIEAINASVRRAQSTQRSWSWVITAPVGLLGGTGTRRRPDGPGGSGTKALAAIAGR
jgi:hypothetical protein